MVKFIQPSGCNLLKRDSNTGVFLRPATLLERDSRTDAFLKILRNYQ